MEKRLRLLLLLCCLLGTRLAAQVGLPLMQHYTTKDFNAESVIWNVVQDSRGMLYMANNSGVLLYDGARWQLIATDFPVRSLALDNKENVYVGCKGDFGWLQVNDRGVLAYVSFKKNLSKQAAADVKTIDRVIVASDGVYFISSEKVYGAVADKEFVQIQPLNLPARQYGSAKIGENLVLNLQDRGLMRIDKGRPVGMNGGEVFKGKEITCYLIDKNRTILGTVESGFYQYSNGAFTALKTGADAYLRENTLYDMSRLADGRIALATLSGGVVVINADGSVNAYVNKRTGLPDNDMFCAFGDREGGLWAGHSRGISRAVLELPVRSLAHVRGIESGIFALQHFRDKLFASTRQGVYTLALAGGDAYVPVAGLKKESWELAQGQGRLLAATNDGVQDVSDNVARPVALANEICLILRPSTANANRMYVGMINGVALLEYKGGRWGLGAKVDGITGEVSSIVEVDANTFWVGTPYNGLMQVKLGGAKPDIKRLGKDNGLPEGRIDAYRINGKAVFRTNEGVFVNSGNEFVKDSLLTGMMPNLSVKVVENRKGDLWMTTESGVAVARLNPNKTYSLETATPANVRQEKPSALYADNDLLWLVYQDLVYSYDASREYKPQAMLAPNFRRVDFGADTTYFRGWFLDEKGLVTNKQGESYKPRLPAQMNNFTFVVSAASFVNEPTTKYSYYLVGYDKDWGPWTRSTEKTYTNMAPGVYNLKVRAMNALGVVSEDNNFELSVATPWYLTTVAFVAYGLLLFVLIFLAVRINASRLEAANRNLEAIVLERTKEVNKQKDEIEQSHAEIVLANQQIKSQQAQIIQSEKMSALGQLVAGVAHEINTPLGAINASAGNLAKSLQPTMQSLPELLNGLDPALRTMFDKLVDRSLNFTGTLTSSEERSYRKQVTSTLESQGIEGASNLAQSLVKIGIFDNFEAFMPLFKHSNSKQLLDMVSNIGKLRMNIDNINLAVNKTQKIVYALKAYSHKQAEEIIVPASIAENLDLVTTIYHNQLKYGIEVMKNYDANLPDIMCYPDQLTQVWTNIIVNAIQAMQNKGVLTLGIHRDGDNHVLVSIQDDGPGIPAHVLPRIFEAFYTTKGQGEGTGLGLDIVRKIIEKHKGTIGVTSEPGNTCFKVRLPIDPEKAAQPEKVLAV